jgi:putative nucleotidyltransferase with HDIG domain
VESVQDWPSALLRRAIADIGQSRPLERNRMIKEPSISGGTAVELACYIEERRRELVVAIVRSPVLPRPGSLAASVFAASFLDCIVAELEGAEHERLDRWVETDSAPEDGAEHARIVAIACSVLSAAFAADIGHSDEVISYLAMRSRELEKRFRTERRGKPGKAADAASLVSKDDVVFALLSAIEARDVATLEHSRAVGMWCGRIAKSLGMGSEMQAFAALAGTLHDVGKIATPADVLLKPGPLDEAEWDVMRAHAAVGGKMLERVPSLRVLAPIVRAHHERMDGAGYPDRSSGDGIPMVSRIVAVADSFHAMISRRPYRDPMTVPEALVELRAGSGTQWDPIVAESMSAILTPDSKRQTQRVAAQSGAAW